MQEGFKRTLLTLLKIVLIIASVFLFIKIGRYIVPFILAFFFASLIEPIVKFIEKKIHIPRKIGTVLSILLALGSIVALFAFLISRLINEIKNVYINISSNMENITNSFNNLIEQINGFFITLPVDITNIINQTVEQLPTKIQGLLEPIVDWLSKVPIHFALNIPQVLVFFLVTILATYFMSSDKNTILSFLDGQIPSDWLKRTRGITNSLFFALFGWLRAQLIIMAITFSELLVGLLIIGVDNAFLIALIIALVDVLPVLGAGSVLVPWSIINLITGNTKLGLSTVLLYVIILFVRQLIEPKIVGKQIGVHPLFTLCGMYIGLKVMGVLGMFVGPLCIIIFKYIFEGILKNDSFKNWFDKNFHSRGRVVLADEPVIDEEKKKKK